MRGCHPGRLYYICYRIKLLKNYIIFMGMFFSRTNQEARIERCDIDMIIYLCLSVTFLKNCLAKNVSTKTAERVLKEGLL